MAELRLAGRPAAGGVGIGRIRVVAPPAPPPPGAPRLDLAEALAAAADQLRALQFGLDGEAADIVEFQIALIEDPALTEAAFVAIGQGRSPGEAFAGAVAVELEGFADAGSELFRARAADIRDARDRVLRLIAGDGAVPARLSAGDILVCDELTPTGFLETDWTLAAGAATARGSPTSHVAMLARSRGLPFVVAVEGVAAFDGHAAVLDGNAGCLLVDPEAATLVRYRAQADARSDAAGRERADAVAPLVAASGRRVPVYLNIDDELTLAQAPRAWFDGIGLARSELLLSRAGGLIDEEAEIAVYRRLFDWSAGAATTIRLLDIGGDKPIAGLSVAGESNPFLGVRGIRLLLRHPDLLRRQMRAILTAAAGRPARILVPMVAVPEELAACRAMLDAVRGEVGGRPDAALGAMVETPALALTVEHVDADFLSIGTNDLAQYVMAASRDCAELHHLLGVDQPAVLALIARVAAHGHASGREVSVCGDMAGEAAMVGPLLAAGVAALSVSLAAAPAVKAAGRAAAEVGRERF